jgi:hypothetical protein
MNIEFCRFDALDRSGDGAMHPPAPRSTRHAALLVPAHASALPPRVLPDTPITALAGAFNCRI